MNMEENGRDQSGKFTPGHPGFKKPKTEFQRLTKTKLGEFLAEKLEDLPAIYKELNAKEKAKLILACAEYFLPKQREHVIDINESSFLDYTKLSESALNEILTLTEKL
jgi:hypothetical protein